MLNFPRRSGEKKQNDNFAFSLLPRGGREFYLNLTKSRMNGGICVNFFKEVICRLISKQKKQSSKR